MDLDEQSVCGVSLLYLHHTHITMATRWKLLPLYMIGQNDKTARLHWQLDYKDYFYDTAQVELIKFNAHNLSRVPPYNGNVTSCCFAKNWQQPQDWKPQSNSINEQNHLLKRSWIDPVTQPTDQIPQLSQSGIPLSK